MFRKPFHFIIMTAWLLLPAALIFTVTGCGDSTSTVTVSQPEGLENALPKTYDTSTESTSNLIRDAADMLKKNVVVGMGVHFVVEMKSTVNGTTVISSGEGDEVFPDQVKMTLQNYTGTQTIPVDVIAIGGKVYTRTSNGAWKSSGGSAVAPDPNSMSRMLDFTRSSRNFGQESLKGNRTTYHVQLDVDTALAADEAKKNTTDPAQIKAIDATRNSTVTVDLWIGTTDLLIYQEKVTTSNPTTGEASEQTFIFSDWGKTVAIVKPCDNC